jgi:hypothetical protein
MEIKKFLKPGHQRRDGVQQEALGCVVQVFEEGEGRLIPVVRVDRRSCRPRCAAPSGAGAKQEPRLFQDLPELLSTAADGPVMCRGFSISAGQQVVWITLGVKGSQVQILSSRRSSLQLRGGTALLCRTPCGGLCD